MHEDYWDRRASEKATIFLRNFLIAVIISAFGLASAGFFVGLAVENELDLVKN